MADMKPRLRRLRGHMWLCIGGGYYAEGASMWGAYHRWLRVYEHNGKVKQWLRTGSKTS